MSRNKYPEETEKLILDVSTKLFMEKGYENTSLQDIINNLGGLTKGAIYHHFKSKEEIYNAVIYRMTADTDDDIFKIIEKKDMNGREKLKYILLYSITAAEQKNYSLISPDYSKNPKMFYDMVVELRNEVAPLLILPIIKEGIADGSITTEQPEELADFLALITNIWINPIVFKDNREVICSRYILLSEMLKKFNLDIVDEEIIKKIRGFGGEQLDEYYC